MAQPQSTTNVNHETRFYHNYDGSMKFYKYDTELYAPTFPLEWAKNHFPETGPECCKMCKTFGFWNGVFVGYCAKCAEQYKGKRGNGFIFYGEEKTNKKNENSAFFTYLKDVDFDKIGDKNSFDSAAVIAEINSYEPECKEEYEWTVEGNGYGSNYDGGYDSF